MFNSSDPIHTLALQQTLPSEVKPLMLQANEEEASMVVRIVRCLRDQAGEAMSNIGVVTPYVAQVGEARGHYDCGHAELGIHATLGIHACGTWLRALIRAAL